MLPLTHHTLKKGSGDSASETGSSCFLRPSFPPPTSPGSKWSPTRHLLAAVAKVRGVLVRWGGNQEFLNVTTNSGRIIQNLCVTVIRSLQIWIQNTKTYSGFPAGLHLCVLFKIWFLPEGCGRGGKDPDEKAGLSSRLVGAGDYQVVSRLELPLNDHLPFVGVASGRGTRWFVQQPAEIKAPFLHLQTENCELNNLKQAHVSQLTNESPNLPHV